MITKFTFKMCDRKKLVVEKPSARIRTLTIVGKSETKINFTKSKADDLLDTMRYSLYKKKDDGCVISEGTAKVPETEIHVKYWKDRGTYIFTVEYDGREVFSDSTVTSKQLKKMVKVMKEVWKLA